jgi:hypothetical protein
LQAWFDEVGAGVVRSEQDDTGFGAGCAIGERKAAGDAGGEVKGKQGGADASRTFQ